MQRIAYVFDANINIIDNLNYKPYNACIKCRFYLVHKLIHFCYRAQPVQRSFISEIISGQMVLFQLQKRLVLLPNFFCKSYIFLLHFYLIV